MKKNFLISLKVKDEIFFSTEKSAKGVIEWEEIYEKNSDAEELTIYEKTDSSYTLIHREYKRKVGF